MKKKLYQAPDTTVFKVQLQQMIAFSGGGDSQGDPQVDPEEDTNGDDNRSRRRVYNVWEDEELEEEFEDF